MIEIKIINEKKIWNSQLLHTLNYNVFSCFEWGEYKKSSWNVQRLAFYKSGNFLGQCQFLIKNRFNLLFAWNSGGINLVDYKDLEVILNAISEYYKNSHFNFRFNFYDQSSGEKLFKINQNFARPEQSINSGFSVIHLFEKSDDLLSRMSSNHRYYYKKALKNNLTIKIETANDIKGFVNLHDEMTSSKELSHLKIREEDIKNLANEFLENFLIFSVYLDETILASCLILSYEDYAFYYLAASNEQGRKTYASYFMIKELFEYLKDKKIKLFDFAGITPYDKSAMGVNKFKIGFGGDVINYIGEQEFCNSKLTRIIFNKMVKYI